MKSTCTAILLLALVYVSVAVQCPTAPANPEDRRTDKTKLSIGSYNAEWLFLTRSNCPSATGCPWHTPAEAEEHLRAIAEEIKALDVDILNLVEVQDCNVLNQLNYLLTEMNYKPYLLDGTDSSTGQNVGLLTRIDPSVNLQRTANRVAYPIPGSKCGGPGTGTTAVSKHYFTTFNVQGLPKPLTVFGAHFLAFPDDTARCIQREAQASVLQGIIRTEALEKGHYAVVLGDLNDFDADVLDASGNRPISSVLHILKDPLEQEGEELFNIAELVPDASDRYTCWYDRNSDCKGGVNELSMIDHILLSNGLKSSVSQVSFAHSYPLSCSSLYSDHWPLLVRLNLYSAELTDTPSNFEDHQMEKTSNPTVTVAAVDPTSSGSPSSAFSLTGPLAIGLFALFGVCVVVATVVALVLRSRQTEQIPLLQH